MGDVEFRRFFFHLFVVMKSYTTSSQNRCPPASPELAMAGRRQVLCIISLSGGLKEYVYQAISPHRNLSAETIRIPFISRSTPDFFTTW